MKVRVWIINAMNEIKERKVSINEGTFEIDNNTYIVDSPYILSKKNKKYLIYSKGMLNSVINPAKKSAKDIIAKTSSEITVKNPSVKFESTPEDTQFQILLHIKGLKDIFGIVKQDFTMILMVAGASFLMGVILMAAVGHIRL